MNAVRALGGAAVLAAALATGQRLLRATTDAGADRGVTLVALLGLCCGLLGVWLRDGDRFGRVATAGWAGGAGGLALATFGYAVLFGAAGGDEVGAVVAGGGALLVLVGLAVAAGSLPVFGFARAREADRRAVRVVGWLALAALPAALGVGAVGPPPLAAVPYLLALAALGGDLALTPAERGRSGTDER